MTLDPAVFGELVELDAKAGGTLLGPLTESFGRTSEKDLACIRVALAAGDAGAIAEAAHALKGAAAAIGATRAREIAGKIEEVSRRGTPGDLPALALELAAAVAEAREDLETHARK